jgi:16S rRNA (adenine1518-N6/adenine1519-N6)-dimethyltransferase
VLAPSAAVDAALERAGVDPLARGESLAVEDFARIAEALPAGALPAEALP